jgi:hypothetical protein
MQLRNDARSVRTAIACAVLLTSLATDRGVAADREVKPAENATPAADGWFDGTPPDGSFRVRGPVAFQGFAQADEKDPKAKQSTQGVRATSLGAFDAVTKYVASCLIDASDARPGKVRLEETLARWKEQADFAYRRDVANGKLAGVEFEMSDPKKTLRFRVFAPPGRVCTLFVQWNPVAKPREQDLERFLASFALAKP